MNSFRIVIDTREQEPYGFECACVRKKMPAGDYSVEGYESIVAVERKSIHDLVQTVIHDKNRFNRELAILRDYQAACIVTECSLDTFLRGKRINHVDPLAVLGAVLYIEHDYGIPVHWCGSRPAARLFTEQFLRMFVRVGADVQRLGP